MIKTFVDNCFIIKEKHNRSIKMRIDKFLCFTVIPHCIVITMCPVLKKDTLWRNMQVYAAFLDA